MAVDRGEDYIYSVNTCCTYLGCKEEHSDDSGNFNTEPRMSKNYVLRTKTIDFPM